MEKEKKMNDGDMILLYEVVERIVRFDIHLDEIKNQFYSDNENKIALIDDFKQELMDLFAAALSQNNNPNERIKGFMEIISCVNALHSYLYIFPRPSEPVELTRFERVIKKQIVQLKGEQELKVSIATNESLGENTNIDPLYDYKHNFKTRKKLLFPQEQREQGGQLDPNLITVTIPRIDAPNTFRWPSLIHEMSHPLIDNIQFPNKGNIMSDFLSYIRENAEEQSVFNSFFANNGQSMTHRPKLENWLKECFCDLLACLLMGPSFFFSQLVVFLNTSDSTEIETHPPHQLRLYLIEVFIMRRFKDIYNNLLSGYIEECNELLERIQVNHPYSFDNSRELGEVSTAFGQYFLFLFFGDGDVKDNPSIGSRLKEIIKRYVTIQTDVIKSLTERLKQGLPIPSVRTKGVNGKYEEIPTYVQEILLASWISKLSLETSDNGEAGLISRFKQRIGEFNVEDYLQLYNELKKIIVRHDQAVLKSIQVSEWFDFFTKEKSRDEKIEIFSREKLQEGKEKTIEPKGVLVDNEIEYLICKDEIKIIPFMYMGLIINNKEQNQIGTTSVDIRLGTSFQVFSSNQYGIVDFTNQKDVGIYKDSSKRIDLDFMESVVIAPGQFMLGHSMEYIKLPDTICGNLEGRSSFARLGIEIHMTAGFIDPGFEGVITFEIYNSGPSAVRLFPGMRIGQLRFELNSNPSRPYSKHNVKYKGLLEHNLSLQSKDVEVALISEYLIEQTKNKKI